MAFKSLQEALKYLDSDQIAEREVEEAVWIPFGGERARKRSIYMPKNRSIGSGSYGIVFAVILKHPLSFDDHTEVYTPCAMKVGVDTHSHIREGSIALMINEMVSCGMTPNMTRTIDCFTVSEALDQCFHPPSSWDRFWSQLKSHIRHKISPKILENFEKNDAPGGMKRKMPLCFIFSELAPYSISSSQKRHKYDHLVGQKSTHEIIERDGDAYKKEDLPKVRRELLGKTWQCIQSVQALHAINIIHGDLHESNFIMYGTSKTRTSYCALRNETSCKTMTDHVGLPGKTRPDDRFHITKTPLVYHKPMGVLNGSGRKHVIKLSEDIPHTCMIDYGMCVKAKVPQGVDSQTALETFWHYIAGKNGRVQPDERFLVSKNIEDPLYDDYATERRFGIERIPSPMPAVAFIGRPTTYIGTRAPEILNPPFFRTGNACAYSTLSDVYSLAALICSNILGFEIFSNSIPVHVGKTNWKRKLCPNGTLTRSGRVVEMPHTEKTRLSFDLDERRRSDKDDIVFVQPNKHVCGEIEASLRREVSFEEKLNTWLPEGLQPCIQSFVARISALGAPTYRQDDIFSQALKRCGIDDKRVKREYGWLYPTLVRVLHNYYNFSGPNSDEMATMLCDALSWDPANRPTARKLLCMGVFDDVFATRLDAWKQSPFTMWSAEKPLAVNWAMAFNNRGDKTELSSADALKLYEERIQDTHSSQVQCLSLASTVPTQRFKERHNSYLTIFPFPGNRLSRCTRLCPIQGLAFYQDNISSLVDPFRGCPLVDLTREDAVRGYMCDSLRGSFENPRTAERYLDELVRYSNHVPAWVLGNAYLPEDYDIAKHRLSDCQISENEGMEAGEILDTNSTGDRRSKSKKRVLHSSETLPEESNSKRQRI